MTAALDITGQVCAQCKQFKSVESYCKDSNRLNGLRSRCKECRSIDPKRRAYSRLYALNNAEQIRKKTRDYRKKNPEKVAAYRTLNLERIAEQRKDYRRRNIEHMLYLSATARCRSRNIDLTIQEEDIVMGRHCPICSVELVIGTRQAPSLDRTDPEQGYIPGNINVICRRCNSIKNEGTSWDHFRIARYMRALGA